MNNDSPEARQLINSFKRAMSHLYPPIKDTLPVHKQQLRDLVRCFTMGYMEALMNTIQVPYVKILVPFYEEMTDDNWRPGQEWHWW